MGSLTQISIADALFSKTKKAAIGVLFTRPDVSFHLRELARMARVTPTMMAKEMEVMTQAGLVVERRDGNRRVFRANATSPIFNELAGIAKKTAGVADIVREALAQVPGIDMAFIFGSVARGEDRATSDVDLFVVGRCDYGVILDACNKAGDAIGRSVNPVIYTLEELAAPVKEENAFMAEVRGRPRILLMGSNDDIARALGESEKDKPNH